MVNRISALENNNGSSFFDSLKNSETKITENRDLILYQVALWPNTYQSIGKKIASSFNMENFPKPNKSITNNKISILRLDPLKWWILGSKINKLDENEGCILDISHSRTHISASGTNARILLNRHLPIDLRNNIFPVGSITSTSFHHVSIVIWRKEKSVELFLPRAFAYSLCEILIESVEQFNL